MGNPTVPDDFGQGEGADETAAQIYLGTLNIPIDKLRGYPGNPRRGDLPAIKESLANNDQYRSIVVQADDPEHPEEGGTVLAGNHVYLGAKDLGWTELRSDMLHVDDERARRIVAVDNRASQLGSMDERLLAELLGELPDLTGTGYDEAEFDKLVRMLDEDAADTGMGPLPEPGDADTDEMPQVWGVIVTCRDEAEQVEMLRRFGEDGLNVRAIVS